MDTLFYYPKASDANGMELSGCGGYTLFAGEKKGTLCGSDVNSEE